MEGKLVLLTLLAGQLSGGGVEVDAAVIERGRALAAEGRWAEAAAALSPVVDPERGPADLFALYTRAVLEAGDLRRARLLSERGLLRFPDDLRFRRLDLAVLVAREEWREAAAAARSVLARAPEDTLAWRQLAAALLETPDESPSEARAALEAAWLAQPSDRVLFERHLRAQLLAGHVGTARDLAKAVIADPDASLELLTLAVRSAEAAEDLALARRGIERVPPQERNLQLSLLEARVALASEDPEAAEAAFDRLIARGEATPAVLLRAARLAEERGALGRAEALYAQAAEGKGDAGRIARLSFARFLAKIRSYARAEVILRAYLAEHPDDAYARQLLQVLKTAK